jgi:hypothetical protein
MKHLKCVSAERRSILFCSKSQEHVACWHIAMSREKGIHDQLLPTAVHARQIPLKPLCKRPSHAMFRLSNTPQTSLQAAFACKVSIVQARPRKSPTQVMTAAGVKEQHRGHELAGGLESLRNEHSMYARMIFGCHNRAARYLSSNQYRGPCPATEEACDVYSSAESRSSKEIDRWAAACVQYI